MNLGGECIVPSTYFVKRVQLCEAMISELIDLYKHVSLKCKYSCYKFAAYNSGLGQEHNVNISIKIQFCLAMLVAVFNIHNLRMYIILPVKGGHHFFVCEISKEMVLIFAQNEKCQFDVDVNPKFPSLINNVSNKHKRLMRCKTNFRP